MIKNESRIRDEIARIVRDCLNFDESYHFEEQQDLYQLGLDSLRILNIMIAIEEKLSVSLNPDLLTQKSFANIDGIFDLFKNSEMPLHSTPS